MDAVIFKMWKKSNVAVVCYHIGIKLFVGLIQQRINDRMYKFAVSVNRYDNTELVLLAVGHCFPGMFCRADQFFAYENDQ